MTTYVTHNVPPMGLQSHVTKTSKLLFLTGSFKRSQFVRCYLDRKKKLNGIISHKMIFACVH